MSMTCGLKSDNSALWFAVGPIIGIDGMSPDQWLVKAPDLQFGVHGGTATGAENPDFVTHEVGLVVEVFLE